MWPISDKLSTSQRPKSIWAKEFERRYREHLATLPPERRVILESDKDPPWEDAKLMQDLLRTVGDFKAEMGNDSRIEQVRPGASISIKYVFISVILKPGIEPQTCGLPEFYRGYWVIPERYGQRPDYQQNAQLFT